MALSYSDESPPNYTCGVDGDCFFDKIGTTATHYEFTVSGLTGSGGDFDFEIPKADAETSGNIDPGKIFKWLMKKLKEALCPSCE